MEAFFKPGTEIKDVKSILQLNVEALKDYDDKVLELLKTIKIKKVKDLIDFKSDDLQAKLVEKGVIQASIDYIMVSSKILRKLIEMKSKDKADLPPMKLAVMGMQNAGKSSLINFLVGNTISEQFKESEPTVSVEQKITKINDLQLAIWDFGGQESFRKEYLKSPEEYLINTAMILFVIDIQDENYYADSLDYLNSILTIMNQMNQKLHVIIDFHKYDPDIASDVDVLVKLQWLEQKFKAILKKFTYTFEFMKTSLFSGAGSAAEPDLAKNLKEIFAAKAVDMSKQPEMALLKNIVYIQTKIYFNLMSQLADISMTLKDLRAQSPGIAQSPIQLPSLPPPPPQKMAERPTPKFVDINTSSLVDELKEAFKRRKINMP